MTGDKACLRDLINGLGGEFIPDDIVTSFTNQEKFLAAIIGIRTQFNNWVKGMNRHFREKNRPGVNLHLFYIQNLNYNAIAITRDDVDGIGINFGLLIEIWKIYCSFAKFNLLEQSISGNYETDSGLNNQLFPNVLDQQWGLDNSLYELDDSQYAVVNKLFEMSLYWVIHHEFCHIWHGHTSYLADSYAGILVDGDDGSCQTDSYSEYRTCFEIDADLRAAGTLFDNFVPVYQRAKFGKKAKQEDKQFDTAVWLLQTCIALKVPLDFMELKGRFDSKILPSRHPRADIRLNYMRNTILEKSRMINNEAMFAHAWNRAEHTTFILYMRYFNFEVARGLAAENVYLEKEDFDFGLHWNELHKKLVPLMRGLQIPGIFGADGSRNFVDFQGHYINSLIIDIDRMIYQAHRRSKNRLQRAARRRNRLHSR